MGNPKPKPEADWLDDKPTIRGERNKVGNCRLCRHYSTLFSDGRCTTCFRHDFKLSGDRAAAKRLGVL